MWFTRITEFICNLTCPCPSDSWFSDSPCYTTSSRQIIWDSIVNKSLTYFSAGPIGSHRFYISSNSHPFIIIYEMISCSKCFTCSYSALLTNISYRIFSRLWYEFFSRYICYGVRTWIWFYRVGSISISITHFKLSDTKSRCVKFLISWHTNKSNITSRSVSSKSSICESIQRISAGSENVVISKIESIIDSTRS